MCSATACPHFGRCGGCVHLDKTYADELAHKKAVLQADLGDFGHLAGDIIPAPERYAYRNKMELAFGDAHRGGALALGIRKKRSFYEVAPIDDCALVSDDFKKIAAFVRDFFGATQETFHHRKRRTGTLRHLLLRRGAGELLVAISTTSNFAHPLDDFCAGLRDLPLCGSIVGILHCTTDAVSDVMLPKNTRILHGRDYFFEELCGLSFKVQAFGFFQTNTAGAGLLFERVRQMCAGLRGGVAYDLYCGSGTIAQICSPHFRHIYGVEIFPGAAAAAAENAERNGITNCTFVEADTAAFLADAAARPDAIIVDPPRDGLHPKALTQIARLRVPIIYISCKAASLARDLHLLRDAGFRVQDLAAFDMFPLTGHLESVAVLA